MSPGLNSSVTATVGLMLAAVTATHAQLQTLDFEELRRETDRLTFVAAPFSTNGFTLTSSVVGAISFVSYGTRYLLFGGSTALIVNYAGIDRSAVTTLTKDDGGLFGLGSIDLANSNSLLPITVSFIGTRSDATTVSQSFTLTQPNTFYRTGLSSFETFTFAGFDDLVSVSWTNTRRPSGDLGNVQFDNIVIIPEPSVCTLSALGLMTLAGAVRQRRKRGAG